MDLLFGTRLGAVVHTPFHLDGEEGSNSTAATTSNIEGWRKLIGVDHADFASILESNEMTMPMRMSGVVPVVLLVLLNNVAVLGDCTAGGPCTCTGD